MIFNKSILIISMQYVQITGGSIHHNPHLITASARELVERVWDLKFTEYPLIISICLQIYLYSRGCILFGNLCQHS